MKKILKLKRKETVSVYIDTFGVEHPDALVVVSNVENNQQEKILRVHWSIFHNQNAIDNNAHAILVGSYQWEKEARVESDIPYSSYDDIWNEIEISNVTKLSDNGIAWVLNYQKDPVSPENNLDANWEIVE